MTAYAPLVRVNGKIDELPFGDTISGVPAGLPGGDLVQLAKFTCVGGETSVTFSSIRQNFTDLKIVYSVRDTNAGGTGLWGMNCMLNGDAVAANYTNEQFGDATGAGTITNTDAPTVTGNICGLIAGIFGVATSFGAGTITIANYAGTTFQKMVQAVTAAYFNGNIRLRTNAFVWKNAAAINQLRFTPLGTAFAAGSTITVYGLGAGIGAATPGSDYKNLIVNGDFRIWQRGTSIASTAAPPDYTADRWAMTRGAGLQTNSQQLAGLTGFQYCMRVARAAADATVARLYALQACETVNSIPFAGRQVVFSFWVRTNGAFPGVLSANLQHGAGVDEGPAAAYTAPQATFITVNITTPNTTWTFYQASAFCAATCTEMKVYFAWDPPAVAAAGNYFEVTGVQVEIGNSASPFHALTFAESLAECQRYYQKSLPYVTAPAPAAGGSGGAQYIVNRPGVQFDQSQVCFPVVMRIVPTITFYCPGAAGATWWNYTRGAVSGVAGVNLLSDSGFGALATQVALDAAGQLMAVSWSASAEL